MSQRTTGQPEPDDYDRMLTPKQAADLLEIRVSAFYKSVQRGKIPAYTKWERANQMFVWPDDVRKVYPSLPVNFTVHRGKIRVH